MKIIFAGTPAFSVPALQAILDSDHTVVAVYTQPDRPAGRGRRTTASPVKQCALETGIPVMQPTLLKDPETQGQLSAWQADLMVVVAYGLILPKAVLAAPRLGCINIHASLLPRWRGAAPIQRAIIAGDTETGVCLMQMEAGLDTGPVFACRRTPINPDDTGSRLHDRLAAMGGALLGAELAAIESGQCQPVPQDDALATYAHKLAKAEALLDWAADAGSLARTVRAFNAWPVAETRFNGKQLRVWEAQSSDEETTAPPGTVLSADSDGIAVACGHGLLRLLRVQLPGGRAVTAADFVNAHQVTGTRLGDTK
ncbi:MAG: methionyl-tRNA formyltransferase [Gammaproteobacteria bacterium]|nr:methionyl-tRNA formyltransferase [Gammaproteobacteria bacterium]